MVEHEGGFMVSGISETSHPFGSIYRTSVIKNGRTVYKVVDSKGNNAGKFSIPVEDCDTFEKAYNDMMTTAPKIQQYVRDNSSPLDIKQRKNIFKLTVGSGGFLGAVIPIYLLRNSPSPTKQILGAVAGIVGGLSLGFGTAMYVNTPPGAFKFEKATHTISNLDIQSVPD